MAEDHSKQLAELQAIEQNLSSVTMQRQNFSLQLGEIESALKELQGKEKAFKIVGNILVEADRATLEKELSEKKEVVELRLKTFEKQEAKLKERMQQLQNDVLQKMK
ncbi:MAG TPA: prefoldin subunit beta [Candidatus Nanoarchaeia archaeon]|nr:prefoldin subunit beta [Candidatus Nanoarchaeia archaeon]